MALTYTIQCDGSTTSFTLARAVTTKESLSLTIASGDDAGTTVPGSDYTFSPVNNVAQSVTINWPNAANYGTVGTPVDVTVAVYHNPGADPADTLLYSYDSASAMRPEMVGRDLEHIIDLVKMVIGGADLATTSLGDQEDALDALDVRLTAAEADIITAQTDIAALEVNDAVQDADILAAEADIQTLQSSVSALLTAAGFPNPFTVNAQDVAITDSAGVFTATEVEGALAELHSEAIYRAQRQWLYSAIARPINRGYALTDANNAIAINGNEMMIGTDNSGGTGADNGVLYSSNRGGSYTARTSTISSLTSVLGLACNADGSLWVAVGVPATNDGMAWSNDNGATWNNSNDNIGQTMRSVAFDGTNFVAVGDAGKILTTPDGTAPTARTADGTPANINFISVRWLSAFNLFVACGVDSTTSTHGEIQTSPTGTVWTARSTAAFAGQFNEVTEFSIRGTTYAMVVGASGEIQYSANATSGWTNIPSASSTDFNSCVGVPGGAVIVGDSGIAQIVTNLSFSKGLYQLVAGVTDNFLIAAYSANTGILIGGAAGKLYQTVDYDLEA